jgi:hypothetical protein
MFGASTPVIWSMQGQEGGAWEQLTAIEPPPLSPHPVCRTKGNGLRDPPCHIGTAASAGFRHETYQLVAPAFKRTVSTHWSTLKVDRPSQPVCPFIKPLPMAYCELTWRARAQVKWDAALHCKSGTSATCTPAAEPHAHQQSCSERLSETPRARTASCV